MTTNGHRILVDQRLLEDLYVEAAAIDSVVAHLAGVSPVRLTSQLAALSERLLEEAFSVVDDGEKQQWWAMADSRADLLLSRGGGA